ncbi:rhodanese-like domain-containing protein [Paenibacillus hamazuiensis]|uniref:rhodanese-like domain-containing protein n=1 Tax=Paenibacillus hamazuiensis TaxID=2936508 RepID=UPI00200BE931|nr:rhodanese-like domain-containing protein [Paenibacillus hamazuiensis]
MSDASFGRQPEFQSIDPEQFVREYENGGLEDDLVIDVREQMEWDYYHLENTRHIPMNSIPSRLSELPDDKTIYVICAHGVRSAAVCNYLLQHGVDRVVNVEGGMAAVASLRGFQYD